VPAASEKRPHFTRERRRSTPTEERAFGITVERRYLYRSRPLVGALETLQDAIARRSCFAIVSGEPGTGKTTLCKTLVDETGPNVITALLLYPPSTEEELLTGMLESLGILSGRERFAAALPTRDQLVRTLRQGLQSIASIGGTTVLIIDEAQSVPAAVLHQLQVLTDATAPTGHLLQVVLVGQPALAEQLRAPELAQLDERLAVRCEFTPLTDEETQAYVLHRLQIADPELSITFSPEVLALIPVWSNGIPRVVNLLCHRALIAAQGTRAAVVDAGMLMTVIADLELAPPVPPRRSWFGRFKRP
jgi:general secretion pathway protein A